MFNDKENNNYSDPFLIYNDDISKDIETTCLNCGFTQYVPDFIYDEMSRKKYHSKINKKVATLYCNNCDKETAIPTLFFK